MNRYLLSAIVEDALADHKMAFISGPRQVGKTHLSKSCLQNQQNYFNWDDVDFKRAWIKRPLDLVKDLHSGPIIIDELHKYPKWKSSLKGFYDHMGQEVPIIITGSARLDLYKRGGDSLLGRYLPYRLHPFSVAESKKPPHPPQKPFDLTPSKTTFSLDDLQNLSGFPEPLLKGSQTKAKRWSRLRLEQIINFDTRDIKNIANISLLTLLAQLLPSKVGSPLSLNSLREDLQTAYGTVVDWMSVLESLYVCFKIPPYHKNIVRGLKKESKYYLFDWLSVPDKGAQLENMVAQHLLKTCHFWTDTAQGHFQLFYVRTKEKLEVDFLIVRDNQPWLAIECKSNDAAISPALMKIAQWLQVPAIQLTLQNVDRKLVGKNIKVMNVEKFLSCLV